tara:strand:- start:235 stop:576 length:342 start_codon:yes stop_codon:yes gene_type:complete
VRLSVTVNVEAEETKQSSAGGRAHQKKPNSKRPDHKVGPPREKEGSRIFRVSVVISMNPRPAFQYGPTTQRSVEDAAVKKVKEQRPGEVPSSSQRKVGNHVEILCECDFDGGA